MSERFSETAKPWSRPNPVGLMLDFAALTGLPLSLGMVEVNGGLSA